MGVRRGRSLRAVLAGVLVFGGLTTVSVAATTALTVGTASASTATLFSSTTPGTYPVVVPPGVTSVSITAVGGTGGTDNVEGFFISNPGGAGAIVTDAAAPVNSGDTLSVTVAGAGGPAPGGAGGNGSFNSGASGGGGSAVYDGLNPLVVAGGGGGGSADAAGAPAGESPPPGNGCTGGGAGTQANGGSPGSCDDTVIMDNSPAQSGGPGYGGNGGTSTCLPICVQIGGGGGGGGYYGGGGATALGGGGGSSYPPADVTGLDATATPSVTIIYNFVPNPSISLTKSASVASYSGPGVPITYSYTVTNNGNVTLNPVTVSDLQLGLSAISCPDTSLTAGSSEVCTATYTTTAADVTAGSIASNGTASGTAPDGTVVTATSNTLIVPFAAPSCYVEPWPRAVHGYPALPTMGNPPPGFFIGVHDGLWKLYAHNLTGFDQFTGTITTVGTFSGVQLISGESGDTVTSPNDHTIKFSFHLGARSVNGVSFFFYCGDKITFRDLKEDGTLVPPSEILLGNPTTAATSNPVVFTKSY